MTRRVHDIIARLLRERPFASYDHILWLAERAWAAEQEAPKTLTEALRNAR